MIFLCRDHHAAVDAQESSYSVEELQRWKREHETAVDAQMEASVGRVTFVELELVADQVMATPTTEVAGFTLTEVREKVEYDNEPAGRPKQHL